MQGLGVKLFVVRGNAAPVPKLPDGHLPRQRLLDPLRGEKRRLCLLCAPAGFGKTVLLSEWLSRSPGPGKVVWLDLAGKAISLEKLCAGVAAQLDPAHARTADPQALLDALSASDTPVRLVLDDLPGEMPADANDWIERLLALPACNVQLLVTCRQRPDWNLPRLMLRGELLELDSRQLAFSRDEFESLLDRFAPRMDGAARADLWRRTQGWCVGVRILLGQGGTAAMPLMHEYLQHELLARMGEAEREVLQGLAHLPKLSAELCAELWEEQGGGLIFQRLLQLQAFLAPVDRQGQWYRLLPLVAHALQGDLAPAELNRLRLRACRLLSMGGHMNEAIELALEASQPEVAASYMERLELEWLLNKDHLSLFIGWLDQMPAHLLQSTSRLLCLSARALLFCGRLDEAEECLQHLGRFVPLAQPARNARLLANWQALYGNLQGLRGNAELSRQHSRDALAGLPARDWLAAVLCHVTLARVAMASGELKEAGQSLQEAVELARRQGCLDAELLVNVERLRLMILQGQFSLAEALLQGDMARVAIGDDQPCPIVGRMLLLEGELHLLQGRLCESEASMQAALQRLRSCSGPHVMPAYVMLSEIAACRGDFDRACMYLHEGERRMHCGNIDDACYKSAIAQQTMRVLGRQGCWDQVLPMARALAERLHGATPRLPPLGMPSLPQRNQLLLSLAEYETGRHEQARLRLAALYEQCKRIRLGMLTAEVQRALVDMGGSAAEHEQDCATEGEAEAGCIAADTSPLSTRALRQGYCLDELTPREVSVLKLLAEGMSNQEIGNTLFISVNTVKYHAKNINAKLGASRRTQAIHWAKAKGILG